MCPKVHLTTHRAVPYLRHPKTFNEAKQYFAALDLDNGLTSHQLAHIVRAKRKPSNLPNLYDDKPVSLWRHSEFTKRWIADKTKNFLLCKSKKVLNGINHVPW